MEHKTNVLDIVRGDTGADREFVSRVLDELGEGKTHAWRRYKMLGGGDVTVTRRGELFEVHGQTKA